MEKLDEYITLIAEKTGQEKKVVKIGLAVVLVLVFILGFGASLIANAVGVIYPAYRSFRAIESEQGADDKKWLTYWLVFAFISFIDNFAQFILVYIPFYFILKLIFLLYLFLPITEGAEAIYERYLLPFYKKYEGHLDEIAKKYHDSTQLKSMKID